jgi:2-polyprenyl-3-methyl-5-hydroxy-6-metoxy-1,4-benzoquinol methylase
VQETEVSTTDITPNVNSGREKCIVCGSVGFAPCLRDVRDYEYGHDQPDIVLVRCDNCGLVKLHPMPTQNKLETFYPQEYCHHFTHKKGLLKHLYRMFFSGKIARIAPYIPARARILDVGCSSGYFMSLLKTHNPTWDVAGLEMREDAVAYGKSIGLNIIHGRIGEAELLSDYYDVIFLNHLIEHVLDPGFILRSLKAPLKPGGRVFLETPNTDCADFTLFKGCSGVLHFPRHTYLFNESNMSQLLASCGFTTKKVMYSLSPVTWARGIENAISDRMVIKRRHGRLPFYYPILLACIPIALVQRMLGNTGIIMIVAERTIRQ